MNYDWDISILTSSSTLSVLLKGFGVTCLLTLLAVFLGTPFGICLGGLACLGDRQNHLFEELSKTENPRKIWLKRLFTLLRLATIFCVDVVRAIPLLILILLAYYGLPQLANSSIVLTIVRFFGYSGSISVSAFQSALVALAVNLAAFVADIVRGAVAGVPRGNITAARSLGMTNWLVWRRIVLPDVMREIFPSLTLLWITIFKMSTLASAVAVYELLHSADAVIQQTYKPLELYFAVGALFVIVILPASILARKLEGVSVLRRRSL